MNLRKWIAFPAVVLLFILATTSAQAKYILRTDFEKYSVGDFLQTDSEFLVYNGNGNQGLEIVESENGNKQLKININQVNDGMAGFTKQNLSLNENFVLKQRINMSDITRRILFRLYDSEGDLHTVKFENGSIVAVNGDELVTVQAYRVNRNYDVKVVVDVSESTYDLYINGYLKGNGLALSRKLKGAVNSVNICEVGHYSENTTLIDNIEIHTYEDHIFDNGAETFYVSETGNNLNPGTSARPFETIEAAKQKIIELNSLGVERNYKVIIRGGTYDGMSFDYADTPAEGYTVTYEAYSGESVNITNSYKVSGWSEYESGIYRAEVPKGKGIKTLYVDNSRAVLARYPDSGYNRAIKSDSNEQQCFKFDDGDIPVLDRLEGVEAVIWPGGPTGYWAWLAQIKNVSGIDYNNRLVTLDSVCSYVLGTGSRYYLQNSMMFLNAENEFFYDASNGYLYYCTDKDINSLDIRYDTGTGFSALSIKNTDSLIFKDLNISKTNRNTDGIYIENCSNITIENCKIFNTGRNGVFIKNACFDVNISNCEIYDIGYTGILTSGDSTVYNNKNHKIRNNCIHDTGKIEEHGTAIQLNQTGDSLITENRIYDIPRYGISLKGITYSAIAGTERNDVKVTLYNYEDFVFTKNNIISYNDISQVNKNSQDCGMIELYGAVRNTVSDNTLHDSSIPFSVGYTIYLDGSSDHNLITRNLMYNLQNEGLPGKLDYVIFSKGIGNRIDNNVLANNTAGAAVGSSQHLSTEPHRDLEITNNIFYNTGDDLISFTNWSDDRIAVCDNNLYYNTNGIYTIGGNGAPAESYEEWKTVLNNKFDQNSLIADPLFADALAYDYRLLHNSPAIRTGFVNFLGEVNREMLYEMSEPQFSMSGNLLNVRLGVTKLFTSGETTKIRIVISDINEEIIYRGALTRILTQDEEVFARVGIDVEKMSNNCRLEIYADNDILYSAYLTDITGK